MEIRTFLLLWIYELVVTNNNQSSITTKTTNTKCLACSCRTLQSETLPLIIIWFKRIKYLKEHTGFHRTCWILQLLASSWQRISLPPPHCCTHGPRCSARKLGWRPWQILARQPRKQQHAPQDGQLGVVLHRARWRRECCPRHYIRKMVDTAT